MSENLLRVGPRHFRAHGLGNDYLVFEAVPAPGVPVSAASSLMADAWPLSPGAVKLVCDRWKGVGSDGIVLLLDRRPDEGEPFPLRMFNPDGSEFERSGNGLRILAAFLAREGLVQEGSSFTVRSGGSLIPMEVHGVDSFGTYDVSVEMGQATLGAAGVALSADATAIGTHRFRLNRPDGSEVSFVPVSVGNPHAVVFSADLSDEALVRVGPFLSSHDAFARGTNVQLAHALGPDVLEIRIWERGVGRTAASGTSSCAAAVAGVALGALEPGPIEVRMPGGRLRVEVSASLDVVLRGPVGHVGDGVLSEGFLRVLGAQD